MMKLAKHDKRAAVAVVLLIALAIVCRILGNSGYHRHLLGLLRSGIYIFLFAAWGVSIQRRIMQKWQRRHLILIAACMVFWFFVRTLKYHLFPTDTTPDIARFLWYCYYIPMLLISNLFLMTSVALGKPEQYHPSRSLRLLWIPAILLILAVLTNDLHQQVFAFPYGANVWTDDRYAYGLVYWIIAVWIFSNAIVAFVITISKCRVPRTKTILWLPLVPFALMIVYGVLCITAWSAIQPFLGDMTAVYCLLTTLVLESGIQCGLVQSNGHYDELFQESTIAAQITDRSLNVCYAAKNVKLVEQQALEQAEQKSVILDGGIRLRAELIRDGYVFWQEDVSELLSVLDALGDTRDELKEYSHLLDEENRRKQRRRELEERKRLYDAVQERIHPSIERLENLLTRLQTIQDVDTARWLHGKVAVLGAYLKRRSNLVFLADRTGKVDSRELFLCLNESASSLHLAGIPCAIRFDVEGSMDGEIAGTLYDFFEGALEIGYDAISGMNVIMTSDGSEYRMTLMLKCEADMSALAERFSRTVIERDEDIRYCSLTCKGGETV